MKRIILSGGGTGGHISPAVAVAEALKRRFGEQVELLFVGAEGRMEMEKIPALGYRIEGLPVAGLQRRLTARNLSLPFKVAASLRKLSVLQTGLLFAVRFFISLLTLSIFDSML